ncbi:MAG: HAMP domain-containing histidine kinase, partial [Thermoleophilia bacterium]|nr:HAMP domain-containing histidine kinase [Thermoleophilia bacterium]
ELALSRPRTAEEYREAIVVCRRAGLRMGALVDDLLTLARVDAGKLEIPRGTVDLAPLAAEGAEMLEGLAEARGVRLVVASKPGPVRVQGDPGRLAQVIANLMGNAIAYNRPGGSVTVAVAEDEEGAVLTVADTGIGIAEEHLPHLFERFYRVDPSRSREASGGPGGNGLGLAICRGIVEAHGGTISVASRPGVGTTFTVRLPRLDPAGPPA